MLVVTGAMIALVLVVMVGNTVRTMQGVGWLSITPIDVEFPLWMGNWLGIYPTVETLVAQALAFAFVVGSYFAAEWWRKRKIRIAIAAHEAQLAEEAVHDEPDDQPPGRPCCTGSRSTGTGWQRPPRQANSRESLRD